MSDYKVYEVSNGVKVFVGIVPLFKDEVENINNNFSILNLIVENIEEV